MKLNVPSDCLFFVIPWFCWSIPAKITTDCMKLFERQHPQAETRGQYRLMLQNTQMKSRGRVLFICHVILVLQNSYSIRVNSPFLLIHHKEILLFAPNWGWGGEQWSWDFDWWVLIPPHSIKVNTYRCVPVPEKKNPFWLFLSSITLTEGMDTLSGTQLQINGVLQLIE